MRSLRTLRETLGDARFDARWAEGSTLSPSEMMDHAVRYVDPSGASSV